MSKTESYISCLDCQSDWVGFCYICKTSAWQIRRKKKSSCKIEINGVKSEHRFICSKRVYGLINQGHKPECVCCEAKTQLTFDHIHPLSKGGIDDDSNGQILCLKCNLVKADNIISIKELKRVLQLKSTQL